MMQFVNRLRDWWVKRNDPWEKKKRAERRKAEKMAKFLERNERKADAGEHAPD